MQTSLSVRERFYLMARAVAGKLDAGPGGMGRELLSRIYPAGQGDPPKRGTPQFLEAYSTSPWLRAVESRISRAVAATSWKLYTVKRQGAPKAIRVKTIQRAMLPERKSLLQEREAAGELVEVEEHPFLTALDKGNAVMDGYSLRALTQVYLDLIGETAWLKERNGLGAPVAFWPIPPTWIAQIATPKHPFFRIAYQSMHADIPQSEIVFMRDLDPVNPYGRGSGLAQAVGDELDTDEYAAKMVRQSFANQARPDFIVMPTGNNTLVEAEARRQEMRFLNNHQGFWRSFKAMFATQEVKIHEFTQDYSKLQLVELRKHERDIILQVTGGIPPEMLGITESSNRATADAASFIFATQCVVPRLEFKRSFWQQHVIPEYDERLILDYESPVPVDKTHQLEAAKAAPWAPSVDEWRAMQGLPPKDGDGGDLHMIPSLSRLQHLDADEDTDLLTQPPHEVVPPAA